MKPVPRTQHVYTRTPMLAHNLTNIEFIIAGVGMAVLGFFT